MRKCLVPFLLLITTSASFADSKDVVYRTRTGERYHSDGCRYLKQSKIKTTVGEARKIGLSPCKVCKPPASRVSQRAA